MRPANISTEISRFDGQNFLKIKDEIVVESPLEIVLGWTDLTKKRQRKPLVVTMRTPGNDLELAVGFLFSEKIIGAATDVLSHRFLEENQLLVELSPKLFLNLEKINRNFYSNSSCGICGKVELSSLDINPDYFPKTDFPKLKTSILVDLPRKLAEKQAVFETTGGLHAAALFDISGNLIALREDIGRHNALDKLIGFAVFNKLIPLRESVILVSGRAGFELVQKATMVGLPILAAVGAPSSLSVEFARETSMTLVGFLRDWRFNVYSEAGRIVDCTPA
jgi:FdhD protein